MERILDGKKLAAELEIRLKQDIDQFSVIAGRRPGLAVIRVGEDPASGVYVSNKEKACARIGIASFGTHLPETSSMEDVSEKIEELNANKEVDGILLQLPLPKGIESAPLLMKIDPNKDADGLHPLNLGNY